MATLSRIKRSLRGCRSRWSLGLLSFEDEYTADIFGCLIALPFLDRWHKCPEEMLERHTAQHVATDGVGKRIQMKMKMKRGKRKGIATL